MTFSLSHWPWPEFVLLGLMTVRMIVMTGRSFKPRGRRLSLAVVWLEVWAWYIFLRFAGILSSAW